MNYVLKRKDEIITIIDFAAFADNNLYPLLGAFIHQRPFSAKILQR